MKRASVFAILLLLVTFCFVAGCTSYDPRSGMYEPDPAKTMMAVGSAAFAGSVLYNEGYHEGRHDNYRRPPNHYHYHQSGPPRHHR